MLTMIEVLLRINVLRSEEYEGKELSWHSDGQSIYMTCWWHASLRSTVSLVVLSPDEAFERRRAGSLSKLENWSFGLLYWRSTSHRL
jgi:hypothetical protein